MLQRTVESPFVNVVRVRQENSKTAKHSNKPVYTALQLPQEVAEFASTRPSSLWQH